MFLLSFVRTENPTPSVLTRRLLSYNKVHFHPRNSTFILQSGYSVSQKLLSDSFITSKVPFEKFRSYPPAVFYVSIIQKCCVCNQSANLTYHITCLVGVGHIDPPYSTLLYSGHLPSNIENVFNCLQSMNIITYKKCSEGQPVPPGSFFSNSGVAEAWTRGVTKFISLTSTFKRIITWKHETEKKHFCAAQDT